MRYTIQYLREATDEKSVCHTVESDARTVKAAADRAYEGALAARALFDAAGFQIRDTRRSGKIVALEALERFARPRWLS